MLCPRIHTQGGKVAEYKEFIAVFRVNYDREILVFKCHVFGEGQLLYTLAVIGVRQVDTVITDKPLMQGLEHPDIILA